VKRILEEAETRDGCYLAMTRASVKHCIFYRGEEIFGLDGDQNAGRIDCSSEIF